MDSLTTNSSPTEILIIALVLLGTISLLLFVGEGFDAFKTWLNRKTDDVNNIKN